MCMCSHTEFRRAGKPIICYKLMVLDNDEIRTYIRRHPVTFGRPINRKLKVPVKTLNNTDILEGEVVHSFANNAFDKTYIGSLKQPLALHKKLICVECEIPKSAWYAKNTNLSEFPLSSDYYEQYASTKVIPKRIVDINTLTLFN